MNSISYESKAQSAADEVVAELLRAKKKHPGEFHTAHEAKGVLEEEYDEWWEEIKVPNPQNARKECVQLAAMALRFLVEFDTMKFS